MNTPTVPGPGGDDGLEQPWLRREDENNLWYSRFAEYLSAGPLRTKLSTYNTELVRKGPKGTDNSKSLPKSWRDAAKRFDWKARAEAFDEWRRKEVFGYRNAQDTERIKKLDEVIEALHERVVKMLREAKPDQSFNDRLMMQYLSALDLMARHTGSYPATRIEHVGKDGGKIEVSEEQTKLNVFWYMPQIDELPDNSVTIEEIDNPSHNEGQQA